MTKNNEELEAAIKDAMLELEARGLVEIKRYDESEKPVYGLTAAGEKYAEELKQD